MKQEENLSIAVCRYLKLQYPKILFTCESSGIRVGIRAAVKMKSQRSCNGLPDLMIFEPRNNYHGLFIELKKEGTKLYKKNGEPISDEHLTEQASILSFLNGKGYMAEFAIGFKQAVEIIDNYLA